ncbi:MAG: septal ring lytic transglycosylase RlpA family protein [Methylocystis sp.]
MQSIGAKMRVCEFMNSVDPACDSFRRVELVRNSCLLLALAALAGCATPVPQTQRYVSREESAVDPRYGVRPSPRMVADGDDVPAGGGRYQVGKPYKIAGKTYVPSEKPYAVVGSASWYGSDFHGRKTANGEIFDRRSLSAAHPTMPLPSYARVTNLRNAHSIVVRVNDRGPYHGGRVMDVSERVAEALDFRGSGTAKVKVEWIGRAELSGSDNDKLLASLRTDGEPATLEGVASPVMTASRQQPVRTAYNAPSRRDFVETSDADGPASSETPRQGGNENMTALVKSVDTDTTTAGARRISATRAPLPPTRPYDLGVAPSASAAREALN